MSFFDLIHELRTKEASSGKAAKAMKVLGWVCVIGGIWNYVVVELPPFKQVPVRIDPAYPPAALVTGLLLGGLFFLAGRGITARTAWGRRLGQLAVTLLVVSSVAAFRFLASGFAFPFEQLPRPFLIIFLVVFAAQFGVPAFFGIQYLGRLPVEEDGYARPEKRPDSAVQAPVTAREGRQSLQRYKEAPLPFGVVGTFVVTLGVPMAGVFLAERYAGPAVASALFFGVFLVIFAGPILYNRMASGFERERTVIASYTGGGSLFLFNGSWPFFRLLVYDDGVEVRVMLHRFFIPYDRMEDLPEKIGFFSRGVLFESDLPEVPSRIRFYGFGSKGILEFVRDRRNRFMARSAGKM